MRSRVPVSYRHPPLSRSFRNLLANPGAFLAAVFGLVFMLAIKVFLVRGRPPDHERER